MVKVNLQDAKRNFSSLLSQIEKRGVTFMICRNGKPVADLVPHKSFKRNIKPHPVLSKIKIDYDPTEPLTSEELGPLEI